ncbi:RNA polymerase I-specific transcription initiation factor RRN3 [Ciona intestinalis]
MTSIRRVKSLGRIGESKTVRFGGKISDALEKFKQGDTSNYQLVLQQLRDPNIKSSQIMDWFQEVTSLSHLLDQDQNEIVNALLKVRWMEREAEVVSTFRVFVVALVSANSVHLRRVIKSLTQNLVPDSKSNTTQSNHPKVTMEDIFEQIHIVFKELLRIIPRASEPMLAVFSQGFPFIRKPNDSLIWYIKNLLFVTSYQPNMRSAILELVIKNLIDLDAVTHRHEIEMMESIEEIDEEEEISLFQMDEEMQDNEAEIRMKHPLANKLDCAMHILFEYFYQVSYREGELQLQETRKLFREIVHIFDTAIMPVHQLIHVQFVVFYICSLKQSFVESFIEHCWQKVVNPNMPTIVRQTYICYIASLLARATFIPLSTVTACIDLMVGWAHSYLREVTEFISPDVYHCDITRHGTFYSICQATFYVIIFKHEDILKSKLGHKYFHTLNLQHLIVSPLNPLKACLSSVVSLFTSTMRQHQLVYCDTIVERNNRQMLPVVGMATLSVKNPLGSFFPFDPYLLKRSSTFIHPIYKVWEGRSPHCEDDDNDDTNKENMEDQELFDEDDSGIKGSFSKQVPPSPLSPGFQHVTPSPY